MSVGAKESHCSIRAAADPRVTLKVQLLPALPSHYVIGIDLGTTNCALAFAPEGRDPREQPPVGSVRGPAAGESGRGARPAIVALVLVSAGPVGFSRRVDRAALGSSPDFVVGALAQKRGAEVASRLVASAKSWLSHAGVDRTAPILPLNGARGRRARFRRWRHRAAIWSICARLGIPKMPDAPFIEQQVLVTVPASFDAVARELDAQGRRSKPATRICSCSKSRKPRSTPGSSGIPIGASASRWAI